MDWNPWPEDEFGVCARCGEGYDGPSDGPGEIITASGERLVVHAESCIRWEEGDKLA